MSILLRSLEQIFPGFARFIPLFVSVRERAAMIIREFGIELGWERFLRALQRCRLALGDETAVVSLKALIPDRDPVYGLLNYGPRSAEDSEKWTEEQQREEAQKEVAKLKLAAKDHLQ